MDTTIQSQSLDSIEKRSDIGFLLVLFVLVVIQFLLFQFGVPSFANNFTEAEAKQQLIPTGLDSNIS